MTHDEINRDCAYRLLSDRLKPTDLVEAAYIGADARLPRQRALWVVVGAVGEMALLAPYPLPMDVPPADVRQAIPLAEFDEPRRAGNLLNDE